MNIINLKAIGLREDLNVVSLGFFKGDPVVLAKIPGTPNLDLGPTPCSYRVLNVSLANKRTYNSHSYESPIQAKAEFDSRIAQSY